MNIKVVVIWALAIVLFFALGIFGMLNQDLLLTDTENTYTPKPVENANKKTCSATLPTGTSAYDFVLNANTLNIERLVITYRATTSDINIYTAASNINNANINGISTNLSGTSGDFVLIVQVNLATLDKTMVDNMLNDFLTLSMDIENITNYDTYKMSLQNAFATSSYQCD